MEEDQGNDTNGIYNEADMMREEIGRLRKFTFLETDSSGEPREVKTLVPLCALYGNRGGELRNVTRNEYRATISFRRRKDETSRDRSRDFAYDDKFILASQFAQYLQAKHETPILTCKAPPYPGKEPQFTSPTYLAWKEKADKYARYFLSEFRPELDCFGAAQNVNEEDYTWAKLEEWMESLHRDPYVMSKFRLMLMHMRMQGFATSARTNKMLTHY